eukprot:TRINITY_DN1088_c0_g1_i2.p1 TRINITY_DN1088_c0_g1~~TRINITY_DN1088_c0_g1_i2.p1  ORF type:complete len:404 (+),score=66.59 TRINITY_DN1088_c0_g1_i2:118-1329(+)
MPSQDEACRLERTKLLLHDEWKSLAAGMNFEEAACEEVRDEPSVVQHVSRSQQEEAMASGHHVSLHAVASSGEYDQQPAQRVHCSHVHELVALRKRMNLRISSSGGGCNQQLAQSANRSHGHVFLAPDSSDSDSEGGCENISAQHRNRLSDEEWEALLRPMHSHGSASSTERDEHPSQRVNCSRNRELLAQGNQTSSNASVSDSGKNKNVRAQRANCLQHEEWEALRKRMNLQSSASSGEHDKQPVQNRKCPPLATRSQASSDSSDSDSDGECAVLFPQRRNCLQHEEWETLRKGMNLHGGSSSREFHPCHPQRSEQSYTTKQDLPAASDSTPTPHIASSQAARSHGTEHNVLQRICLADNMSEPQKQEFASGAMGATAIGSQESYEDNSCNEVGEFQRRHPR